MSRARSFVPNIADLCREIVADTPKLSRGQAWCRLCGASVGVDAAKCLRGGWPVCCGETMTIDSPEERAAPARKRP